MRSFLLGSLLALATQTLALGQGYPPDEVAAKMTVAPGFDVSLVASEPHVRQPVAIDFDDRGRLWVVQYLQYPNPAGLQRVKVDRYSRTVYDRVPEPPPHGPRGDDKITILEDTDSDGRVDQSKDFVDGLNLTTGFAFGHGGVFVLNVPYLLFYPDRNRDDVPDGDPEVCLKGFGMEDTSSLANSLIFGPDGWLYGTQGTNITANIRGIEFQQGVWRYHPVTKEFELFCEGGANSWGLDFDADGHLLFATNYGGYLFHHGWQGAYYAKSFQKHGELHNPFAFGWFDHVPHENFTGGHVTVGGLVYQEDAFGDAYRGKYIGGDLLGHALYWHDIHRNGSTFKTSHGGTLFAANDTWFAPDDVTVGPDGSVYVADWHDKRTAHPDPDADWDRSNGRVVRVQAEGAAPQPHVDPNSLTSEELVGWLTRSSEWHVRRARRILGERRDETIKPRLIEMLRSDDDRTVLQGLWAMATCGWFDANSAVRLLEHRSAPVRMWTVRLMGDNPRFARDTARRLVNLARTETNVDVAAQLACSAKRLASVDCVRIVRALAERDEFVSDPSLPLLCWWAVEPLASAHAEGVVELFASEEAWERPLIRDAIVGRLMRRLAAEGSYKCYEAAAELYQSAPESERRRMLTELDAGLALIDRKPPSSELPLGTSFVDIAVVNNSEQRRGRRLESVPPALKPVLNGFDAATSVDPLILRLATRLGAEGAYERVLELTGDRTAEESLRISALEIVGEFGDESAVDVLLPLAGPEESPAVRAAALQALAAFNDDRIAEGLLREYAAMPPELRAQARAILFARPAWAMRLLQEVDRGTYDPKEIPVDELRRIALHGDADLDALVRKHWGGIKPGTPEEKLAEIRRLQNDLRAADGDAASGHELFKKHCGTCHKLREEGNTIGPDLTTANRGDKDYLLVSVVDPSSQIRKEFMSYTVATTDGRVVTGLLIEQSAAGVTLVDAKNQRTTIPQGEIDDMQESEVSLMPENILKPLSPQEVRDLFAYLQQ